MVTKKEMENAEAERKLISGEKMNAKSWLILIFGVLLAGVVRAIGVYSFVVPNHFAPGGVTGVGSILEYKFPVITAGYTIAAINVPLIIIAFIFIGKRFAIISGIAILLSSGLMVLFPYINFPIFDAGNDRILAAIAGGLICGVGIAIMLKLGGSNGGTDIIAALIQKKVSANTNIAWYIFCVDSTVVIASIFVYDDSLVPALLSFVEMFASSKVAEIILQGFKSALKVEIITNHSAEIAQDIFEAMHRGVTKITTTGMYTGEEHAMLVCILRKRQLAQLRAILKKYPDTFAYISETSEVVGRGFASS